VNVPAALVVDGGPRQFRCEACRAVWAVLHAHGLDAYHALREATGA
jgi:hypothetical protein